MKPLAQGQASGKELSWNLSLHYHGFCSDHGAPLPKGRGDLQAGSGP